MSKTFVGRVDKLADRSRGYLASCSRCRWQLAKRREDDAVSLLRSHFRITHYTESRVVYLTD